MDKKYNGSSVRWFIVKNLWFCNILSCYLVLWPMFLIKLLQMTWKLPHFETFCPLNVKERAEGLNITSIGNFVVFLEVNGRNKTKFIPKTKQIDSSDNLIPRHKWGFSKWLERNLFMQCSFIILNKLRKHLILNVSHFILKYLRQLQQSCDKNFVTIVLSAPKVSLSSKLSFTYTFLRFRFFRSLIISKNLTTRR